MNNRPRQRISAAKSQRLTKLLTISKTATMDSSMESIELARIIGIVIHDIGKTADAFAHFPKLWEIIHTTNNYYYIPIQWFTENNNSIHIDLLDILEFCDSLDDDFDTYLKCLIELHKRRRKFEIILQRQPLPTMVQISPRALIEYGTNFPPESLASWLTWRKFFYDLDNRSAQETGYLFEPILAASIGGESKSAKDRVVVRSSDASKGRQVDCWKILPDGTKLAYELKLRVTIAASGQGRFAEELSFAEDCQYSGVKPILIVLDPTANQKLSDLKKAYQDVGGDAYVGNAAWEHLETEAGATMSLFIEKYVRIPINSVSSFECVGSRLLRLSVSAVDDCITLAVGDHEKNINRTADPFFDTSIDE